MSKSRSDISNGAAPRSTATAVTHHQSRAVSYALGFVLVFSVLIAGTFVLFGVGVDVLATVDRHESVTTNQESVEVIHSEVGDMTAQGAHSRTLSLDVVDATIGLGDTVRLEIESDAFEDVTYETRELTYEVSPHERTFVFAFGHVYRVAGEFDSGVISDRPPVFDADTDETRVVVPKLRAADAGPTQIATTGTSERPISFERIGSSSFRRTNTGPDGVEELTGTLRVVGSDHPDAWVSALEATGFTDIQQTGGTVVATFESDRVVVHQATLDVELGGGSP